MQVRIQDQIHARGGSVPVLIIPDFQSILVQDSAIHRYHRADVDFPVQVGTRIPSTIEFYDPPAQVVQIDPVFRDYKIVVLDDVILVVDPSTREIVDVIRT